MIFQDVTDYGSSFLNEYDDVLKEMNRRIDEDIPGEYPIRGSHIFVKILHYHTKTSEFITESHRDYVDFQVVYDGVEIIRLFDIDHLQIKEEYNPVTDCQFYHVRQAEPHAVLTLRPGKAALFFPHDAHETQIASDLIPKPIKKAVVKIHVKFFA
jgi:YhcH/YjgK/YiaL family protein